MTAHPIEAIDRALAQDPRNVGALIGKADHLAARGDVRGASAYYLQAVRVAETIRVAPEMQREVDEIIMEHPAVHQCVTFGVPHDMLGEDVAAAIVLKEGAQADDKELRQFAAVRLADFKVPRRILILKEIPVGATGKLQRIGLAKKLGLG